MSCPFCAAFAAYRRQIDRRLDTATFGLSEVNAHRLLSMAWKIRGITRTTLRRVENEAVPTMLCDLLDGLADGLIEGLSAKLTDATPKNGHPASADLDSSVTANGTVPFSAKAPAPWSCPARERGSGRVARD